MLLPIYFEKELRHDALPKGYTTEKIPIAPELNPWYVGNMLFYGIPGMMSVAHLTGSMWSFSRPNGF